MLGGSDVRYIAIKENEIEREREIRSLRVVMKRECFIIVFVKSIVCVSVKMEKGSCSKIGQQGMSVWHFRFLSLSLSSFDLLLLGPLTLTKRLYNVSVLENGISTIVLSTRKSSKLLHKNEPTQNCCAVLIFLNQQRNIS